MSDGYDLGLRQFQEDFEALETVPEGLSTTRRPHAVTFDYLVSFSLGPVAIADASEGAYSWVWRSRVVGNSVRICRENDTKDGWLEEIELFTFEGAPILEHDIAFEQLGRVVLVAERATGAEGKSELWIYFYEPFEEDFVFWSFGEGRNARTILDNPLDITDADVQVFYINDTESALCFRQQRDRYDVEYLTPLVGTENSFVEDVIHTVDNRMSVVISVLHPEKGTYTLTSLTSTLYPFLQEDYARLDLSLLSGDFTELVLTYGEVHGSEPVDADGKTSESLLLAVDILDGSLMLPLISVGAPELGEESDYAIDLEQILPGVAIVSGSLVLPLIIVSADPSSNYLIDAEPLKPAVSVEGGSLVVILIVYGAEPESIGASVEILSGSLQIP